MMSSILTGKEASAFNGVNAPLKKNKPAPRLMALPENGDMPLENPISAKDMHISEVKEKPVEMKGYWFFVDTSSDSPKVIGFKNGVHNRQIDNYTQRLILRSRGLDP